MKIGILGAGQLARMLSLAGTPLGMKVSCLGEKNACASDCVHSVSHIPFSNLNALIEWAKNQEVITFENENIDVTIVQKIAEHCPVYPPVKSIEIAQDRLQEKTMLNACGVETALFKAVNSFNDLQQAVAYYGLPAIVKTRRFGYDGKGQFCLETNSDVHTAWAELENAPGRLIFEGFIDFDFEVSLVGSVAQNGHIAFYPLTKNTHSKGILRESIAPYKNDHLTQQAQTAFTAVAKQLGYVGTLAIEFFVCGDNLIANEIAPRVHNSGHWTIEGTPTSQFKNHIRAITGLPLGTTTATPTVMFNCIGTMPDIHAIKRIPNAHYHAYNKAFRPGRKVGHITISNADKNPDSITTARHLVTQALDY